ncbi:MAG: hypothetical protein EPN84_08020 [Legionella sp.]|nr:MAG: hypothetical protein EPN84_08020 [Legionella sp.]
MRETQLSATGAKLRATYEKVSYLKNAHYNNKINRKLHLLFLKSNKHGGFYLHVGFRERARERERARFLYCAIFKDGHGHGHAHGHEKFVDWVMTQHNHFIFVQDFLLGLDPTYKNGYPPS